MLKYIICGLSCVLIGVFVGISYAVNTYSGIFLLSKEEAYVQINHFINDALNYKTNTINPDMIKYACRFVLDGAVEKVCSERVSKLYSSYTSCLTTKSVFSCDMQDVRAIKLREVINGKRQEYLN